MDEAIRNACVKSVHDVRGFDRSECVEVTDGHFAMRAYPGNDCANEYGNAHGGWLLCLADMAASGAATTSGRDNVTMSCNANFLRPVRAGDPYVTVTADVVHMGVRTAVVEVKVMRPNGELSFTSSYTLAMFPTSVVDTVAGNDDDAPTDNDAADHRR